MHLALAVTKSMLAYLVDCTVLHVVSCIVAMDTLYFCIWSHLYTCSASRGLKTASSIKSGSNLSKQEIAEVCKRRDSEEGDFGGEDRIAGVGFKRLVYC